MPPASSHPPKNPLGPHLKLSDILKMSILAEEIVFELRQHGFLSYHVDEKQVGSVISNVLIRTLEKQIELIASTRIAK